METIMKNDLTWEHLQHNTFQEGCSDCYSENRLVKAKVTCMCKIDKSCLGTNIRRWQEEDINNNPNPLGE